MTHGDRSYSVTVTGSLRFERDYEFSSSIVWEALIDADLVSGWLAEATIVPEIGGEYVLRWRSQATSFGRISRLHTPEHLVIDAPDLGSIRFDLEEFPGGSRGISTRLQVNIEHEIEAVFAARIKADWLTNLDQLEDLLRGHPVDWANWERDRQDSWTQHLDEIRHSTA